MHHQIMTTIIWIHIHDVIHDVTKSQDRLNFEIDIFPSIFEVQRRSKAPNVGNAYAIFLVYSPSGITSGKKVCRELKMAAILNILKYETQLQFDLRCENIDPNCAKKKYFHDDDVIDDVTGWPQSRPSISLYIWNNNIFMITKQRPKISSLNFLCICIMRL